MSTLFILTIIPGFFTAKFIAGKKAGEQGRLKSLRFRIRCHIFHIHHWVWSLGLVIILPQLNLNLAPLRGLLLGFVVQGLTYSDFYKFLYREKKESDFFPDRS